MLYLLRKKIIFGRFLYNYSEVVNRYQLYRVKDVDAFPASDQSRDFS